MIDKTYTYAIVGASNDASKYGYVVMKDLLGAGFKVVPINLHEEMILGKKVYPTLSDYPNKIDVVVFLVPPRVVVSVLEEVRKLKISKVWMQPGSESPEAIDYCSFNAISCVHHACIMVERRKK